MLKQLVNDSVTQIGDTLPDPLSEEQASAIAKIIENALVEAIRKTTQSCSHEAVVCCGPEADMAHKISDSLRRTRKALIANLMVSS